MIIWVWIAPKWGLKGWSSSLMFHQQNCHHNSNNRSCLWMHHWFSYGDVIFQVVQCLCVQLTKTYFVFPRLSVPVRQSIYLPVGLSACPSIRFISRSIRPNVFLQFACFVIFVRGERQNERTTDWTSKRDKTKRKWKCTEWMNKSQTRTECETENEKNKNNQTTNIGTCPEQPTQRWFKTPFNCCCCCLGHHIVFWDGCGAGCVVVFAVQLGCQSHSFVMLCLGPRNVKNSGSPSMGDKMCTRIFQLFWNCLAQNHAYIYISKCFVIKFGV